MGGKKYLDLLVWDSTISMSEGENGNSYKITTGAQNSPPYPLLRCLPPFFCKLCNISLADCTASFQFVHKILATFSLLEEFKGKLRGDGFGTWSYSRTGGSCRYSSSNPSYLLQVDKTFIQYVRCPVLNVLSCISLTCAVNANAVEHSMYENVDEP